jgi:hypothetical protein
VIAVPLEKVYATATTDKVVFRAGALPVGAYYARLQNGSVSQVRAMLKIKH